MSLLLWFLAKHQFQHQITEPTQLQHHPAPDAAFMQSILEPLGRKLAQSDLTSERVRAGCARCGACSSLKSFECK